MNVWWCNQSRNWRDELEAGVVCSSSDTTQPKYRMMVRECRKSDIIVHYHTGKGIVAISRARENPIKCRQNDTRDICLYGAGWSFPAEYHLLATPIKRSLFIEEISKLEIEDGPIQRMRDAAQVRQAYFMRFNSEGLRTLLALAPKADWPEWLPIENADEQHATPSSPDLLQSAIEGTLTEAKIFVRKRDVGLRDEALARSKGICAVCDKDYSKILGGKGVRALQVHHVKQLSASDEPRVTNIDDLAVVCATCHCLIHADIKQAMSVQELRRKLEKDK